MSDILWQHDDGSLQIWFMNGHKIRNRIGLVDDHDATILAAPPWRIVATGDFNSNGSPDILWQHDDGSLQIWFMNGHKIKSRIGLVDDHDATILAAPPWRIVATGDSNSNGSPDILWQHDDGSLQIWFMNGHKIKSRIG
ncbi:FG-GAP-like repeat-containing protein, partial [Streptomyces sp. NPDC051677]|uniref:FG-GAP-like repeat-containing protein n=1 Tax=Streptomyces sp. NPDC051677 TaxID=3365669 RepID=UPI0037D07052